MTTLARTRTREIAARVLATLGVALGLTTFSGHAGAIPILFDGLTFSTTCELIPPPVVVTGVTGPVTNTISSAPCAGSDFFGPYSASAQISSSSVDYGVMKMKGDATASGLDGGGVAVATLDSRDFVTYQSGALSGQGTVYASMQLLAIVNGGGNWCLAILSGASFGPEDICTLPATSTSFTSFDYDCSDSLHPCVFDFSFPVTFGTPTQLDIKLVASTAAVGPSAVSSSIDLSQSLYWAGIQSVTFGGQAVEFSLTAASGHDWTESSVPGIDASVPEPGSLALLALGLAGLGFARCRLRVS